MHLTQTDVGPVLMLDRSLHSFRPDDSAEACTIALCVLLHNGKPNGFGLVWQWGGDWMGFLDGAEYDAEQLSGWEPDALLAATRKAVEAVPECAEEMDWYTTWARRARATLESKE